MYLKQTIPQGATQTISYCIYSQQSKTVIRGVLNQYVNQQLKLRFLLNS